MTGSILLRDYKPEAVIVSCSKCGKRITADTSDLIQKFGGDIKLPDLLWKLTECKKNTSYYDWCNARFEIVEDDEREVFLTL